MLGFLGFISLAKRINRVVSCMSDNTRPGVCVSVHAHVCTHTHIGKQNLMTVTRVSYKVGELAKVESKDASQEVVVNFQVRNYKILWTLSFVKPGNVAVRESQSSWFSHSFPTWKAEWIVQPFFKIRHSQKEQKPSQDSLNLLSL